MIEIEKKNGRFDLIPVYGFLRTVKDGVYAITIKRVRQKRTNNQNEWLWGDVYPRLLLGLIDAGWEFTDNEQIHEFFKAQFAMEKAINRHTGEIVEFPASTALMDTVTFSTYVEKLRDYAREYLGIDIPDPNKNWKNERSTQ